SWSRSRRPAPISSRLAIASSPMHAGAPRLWRTRRDGWQRRRRPHENRARCRGRHFGARPVGSRDRARLSAGPGRTQPAVDPTPPPPRPPANPVAKPAPNPAPPKPAPPKPAPPKPAPTQAAAPAPPPAAPRREADIAYGAYQRGHYITAFSAATRRVEERK